MLKFIDVLTNEELVVRALNLDDYMPEVQKTILAEVKARPGCQEQLEALRQDAEEFVVQDEKKEEQRKLKFPGFVLGVGISVIILTLLDPFGIGNFFWRFWGFLVSAAVFLPMFDARHESYSF